MPFQNGFGWAFPEICACTVIVCILLWHLESLPVLKHKVLTLQGSHRLEKYLNLEGLP